VRACMNCTEIIREVREEMEIMNARMDEMRFGTRSQALASRSMLTLVGRKATFKTRSSDSSDT